MVYTNFAIRVILVAMSRPPTTQLQNAPGGGWGGGGVTCDKVPFREFVHTIATRKTSDRIAQFVVYSNGRQDPVGD